MSDKIPLPDLQGLRAVAVLAVMLFHFGVPLPGGFLGVDAFFVLSGYFIVRMLQTEALTTGRIDLVRFWARRARRLLPNALLVLIATLAAATILVPGYRLPSIGTDVLAAGAFAANLNFVRKDVDYFHLGDLPSPVLHFWSLAVEEQFYLVNPIVLLAAAWLWRRHITRSFAAILLVAGAASFVAMLVVADRDATQAFYLPQFRAWQLCIGGLAGLAIDNRHRLPAILQSAMAWAGAGGLLVSFVALAQTSGYPNAWALLPTLSVALYLLGRDAGGAGPIRVALSLPPLTMIGNRSYSLYLWHWPVIVLTGTMFGAYSGLIALALSVALAFAAYTIVEKPIHKGEYNPPPILTLAVAVVAIATVGGLSVLVRSMPSSTSPATTAAILAAAEDLGQNYGDGCHLDLEVVEQPACIYGNPDSDFRVMLFGDSHAAQWFSAINSAAQQMNWRLDVRTKSSCPASLTTIWYPPKNAIYEECSRWVAARLAEIAAEPPDILIIGNWSGYERWLLSEDGSGPADIGQTPQIWQEGTSALLSRLQGTGARVIWLRDTPAMDSAYRDCLSLQQWSSCGRERLSALSGLAVSIPAGVEMVDFSDALCTNTVCPAADSERIWYRDPYHLTSAFAAGFAPVFRDAIASGQSRGAAE